MFVLRPKSTRNPIIDFATCAYSVYLKRKHAQRQRHPLVIWLHVKCRKASQGKLILNNSSTLIPLCLCLLWQDQNKHTGGILTASVLRHNRFWVTTLKRKEKEKERNQSKSACESKQATDFSLTSLKAISLKCRCVRFCVWQFRPI